MRKLKEEKNEKKLEEKDLKEWNNKTDVSMFYIVYWKVSGYLMHSMEETLVLYDINNK